MKFAEFEVEDIRQADAIFSGSVLSYEIVSSSNPGTLEDYGLIKVRVEESLKGDIAGDVQLYWWNSTFGMPEELNLTDPALFAVVAPGENSLPLRGSSATIFPSRRPDLLQVFQAPCAGAFMLPYASGSAENVRRILQGESIDLYDNLVPRTGPVLQTIPATHRVEHTFDASMAYGAIGLSAILVSVFLIWRRWRRMNESADQLE
ncbi:hypothetical protein [Parasphingorhabdus sp.]|uniref:hypothetical protein n=1 Tax=Parasphingorhabdus sp. TaxID=2709688 RepID=UPI0032676159